MEASGTPLGGGALKLEATHLRQMVVPVLTNEARSALDAAGRTLTKNSDDVQAHINRIVLQGLLRCPASEAPLLELAGRMAMQTDALRAARQRVAS